MIRKLLVTLLVALGTCLSSLAQQHQVSGTVRDQAGKPIAGATILVRSSSAGTTSNGAGSYTVAVPANDTLLVSFIGYQPQQIAVAGKTRIDVVLKEDTQAIDDVIVVAFGTAKKEAFTGSAKVVKSDDIAKSQQSNVAQALAGKVAGVQLVNTSGQPGKSPEVRIRGFSSLNADNKPLWIVDGMPYSGDLNNLNPNDVESMTVLKDAASNSLYGARGANGVVMVTTKKAKSKEAVITVDAKWGVNSRAVKDYEYITNPAQFYETHYNALKNYYLDSDMTAAEAHAKASRNLTGSASDGGLGYMVYTVPEGQEFIGANGKVNPQATLGRRLVYQGEEYYVRPDDWTDAAFRTSLRQEYNVSIGGSGDKTSVYASFGYLNNEGIAYNSDMDRFTGRVKLDYQAKKWLKMGINANYARFHYNQIDDDGAGNSSGNVFAYTAAVGPIYPLYIRGGDGRVLYTKEGIKRYDYGENAGMERSIFTNSNALSDSRLNTQSQEGNAFNGTTYFDISFLKDFKFTFNAGVTLDETRSTTIMNPYFGQFAGEEGLLQKGHQRRLEYNSQQILNYTKQVGEHNVNAMIGHEYYNSDVYVLAAAKSHMLTQDNDELAGAIIDKQNANSYCREYNNEGYFARVMYDYANRYFFSASFRRDASSRFHADHRWGNFWSLGGAWIITRENFMAGTEGWLDNLKLKASIGSQGNDNIGDFRYTNTYTIENANGEVSTVFKDKGSKSITWETNSNFNAGVEFSLRRGLVSGGIEYFLRRTTDMLLRFPTPPSMGYSSYYANVGDMRNSGIEIDLNFTPVNREHVQWDINVNMTHLRNKVTMLPPERRNKQVDGYYGYTDGDKFYGEGLSMYTFYTKKYAGVSDEGKSMWYMDEVDKDNNPTGRRITTTEYADASDYLCGNPIPDLYGGFGTSLNFYGFDFSIAFTYQIGGVAYDSGYAAAMYSPANKSTGQNWHKDILKAWSPENPTSDIPRLQYEDQNQNGMSDRFLTDASYLNLQNINFGYTLPSKVTKKFGVDRVRVYLSCENVWYWSKRQGFDPRYSYTGATSQASYSPVRTISGGINLQF